MTTGNVGDRAGKLVVLSQKKVRNRAGQLIIVYGCKCDCGNEKDVLKGNFGRSTLSCGCLKRARWTEMGLTQKRHGMTKTPEHRAWIGMRQRCRDKNHLGYSSYGGRGISVCERWTVFENFLEDMGMRPSLDHSVDRIDVNGNYEPGNCRWATRATQARNKRPRKEWHPGKRGSNAVGARATTFAVCALSFGS
jgi:hypothetical protein